MATKSECDCCGKVAVLHRAWVTGIETFACAACHGDEPDAYDDELDEPANEYVRDNGQFGMGA